MQMSKIIKVCRDVSIPKFNNNVIITKSLIIISHKLGVIIQMECCCCWWCDGNIWRFFMSNQAAKGLMLKIV